MAYKWIHEESGEDLDSEFMSKKRMIECKHTWKQISKNEEVTGNGKEVKSKLIISWICPSCGLTRTAWIRREDGWVEGVAFFDDYGTWSRGA